MESEGLLPLPTDAPTLPPGTVVGRCKIIRLIATGGQGSIYLAHHEALDKSVALKVLPPSVSGDEEFVRRFIREARSAARLEHPNIVQVFDAASENGTHFIIMQFVDGKDLDTILAKKPRAPVTDALSITKRVAVALGAAHKAGIIHRDIKPSNIMITKQGKVMITDFGLARDMSATMSATITQGGYVMGTPDYLSPEQACGERTDARSDIYSLGATLYRLIGGRPPYPDGNPMTVMMKHVRENEQPQPLHTLNPEVTPAVESLVNKMMAKSPSGRFQTMEEVVAAIDMLRGHKGGTTQIEQEAVPAVRKKMWVNMVTGVAIGVAAVILLILVLRPNHAARALRTAEAAEQRAEKNESLLPEAIRAYREIMDQWPGSSQAEIATQKLPALDAKWQLHKQMERLSDISSAYPGRPFHICAGEIREILGRKPPEKVVTRGRELLRHLSRAEILARAGRAAELVKAGKYTEALEIVDPDDRKLGSLLRRLGGGGGDADGATFEIQVHADRLEVDADAGWARLPATTTVTRAAVKTTHDRVWKWKVVRDEWFLELRE